MSLIRRKTGQNEPALNKERSHPQRLNTNASAKHNKLLEVTALDFKKQRGIVYLVGAGPGDSDLLTVKALRLLQNADVVLFDALVSDEIMALINPQAEQVHVGKRASHHFVDQQQTNRLLVKYAKLGKQVVRLKGGDPFIFGRGGEELQVLKQNNIRFEVVPGITAASGCTAYAGIPLTHRDFAQSVRFITAHQKGDTGVDWSSMAKAGQTLVFYMGLMKNQSITKGLIENGLSRNVPVAVIENGTLKHQRVVVGQLKDLSELVSTHQIKSPALIVVGEVVALAEQLSWFNGVQQQPENQLEACR